MDKSSAQENSQSGKSSSPKRTTSEINHEFGSKSVCSEPVEQKHVVVNENVQNGPAVAGAAGSDYIGIERSRPIPEDLTKISSFEQLGSPREDTNMNSSLEQFELLPEDATGKSSGPKQTTSELDHEFGSESIYNEPLEHKQKIGTENVQNRQAETRMAETNHMNIEQLGVPHEVATKNSSLEQLRPPSKDVTMKYCLDHLGSPTEDVTMNSNLEHLGALPDDESKNFGGEQLGQPQEDASENLHQSGRRDKRTSARSRKGKYTLRSLVECTRVLRSRSQEKSKAPEPGCIVAEHGRNEEKRRGRRKKKKQIKKIPVDEFSRIRKHLRYILTRMRYEQNLIDAYSGEGWKGQSLEKVKLEKELERAKSEIFRCKLKIRDLFQRLDLSCAEGKLPKSLFDSEGQIDSEDIFCAKCGSKDLLADNDIILCDGACERGFHQFCLEPPLLKEDIPPDDEGWLCPGCDCKVDCIDLLNESQGTNLSVADSWKKVFPEAAAAAAAGNKLDDSFGFPSDDSQDDDYDPDGPEVDERVQGDESSSDEPDFFSASDDFEASPNHEQYLGLPSDDSEDDDYDPNAPVLDEQVKQESSSSDFTSDSEDFSVAFDDNRSSGGDGGPMSSPSVHLRPSRGSDGERSKLGGREKQSLNDELLSLLDSDPGQGDPVSRKRHVERLDYKNLHDETYGNVSSDSSDEDWKDTAAPKKRKSNTGEVALVSPYGRTAVVENGANVKDMKHDQKEGEHTSKRRAHKKLDVEGTNNLPTKSHKGSEPGSSGKSTTRSARNRLGAAVTQRLLESFKENQYPERATKENLVKELGITLQQVSKWFGHARWSFRHSSRMELNTAESSPNKGTPSPQVNKNMTEPAPKMFTRPVASNGAENKELPKTSPGATECCSSDERSGNLLTSRQKSTSPKSGKRKGILDHQASDHISGVEETPKQGAKGDSPTAQDLQKSDRIQTRRRKSVA
uniref:Homeobox protein HAT3.1 n=1 Tax=Davidia involucrata TaxID=16924 RepID=A0A5B7AA23_DAVIN